MNFCSTRNQRGSCHPILATVRWYHILQHRVFVWCPLTRTCRRRVDVVGQCNMPSTRALALRSTRNQLGNFTPILVTLHWYRILQHLVFVCCPSTHTCRRRVTQDARLVDLWVVA
jgi:hypothetical protein